MTTQLEVAAVGREAVQHLVLPKLTPTIVFHTQLMMLRTSFGKTVRKLIPKRDKLLFWALRILVSK